MIQRPTHIPFIQVLNPSIRTSAPICYHTLPLKHACVSLCFSSSVPHDMLTWFDSDMVPFSFIGDPDDTEGFLGRITASCPPIRLSKALCSLAPNANLCRLSSFSCVRVTRCFSNAGFCAFFRLSSMFAISCWAESEVSDVLTVLATDGA